MSTGASREKYFAAALQILTDDGPKQLTMTALHQRLDVSSGSFYHFFRNWNDFTEQFLDDWTTHTADISAAARRASDPVDRLEVLRVLARTVPHSAEAALRIWGATNPAVAAAQSDIDERRLAIIRDAVVAVGVTDVDADLLSRHGLSVIVGWQQVSRPFDVEVLDAMLGQFIDLVRARASGSPSRPPTASAP